jgi:hypothetical protein
MEMPVMTACEFMGVPEHIDPEASYEDTQRIKQVYVSILKDDIFEAYICQGCNPAYFEQIYGYLYEHGQELLPTCDTFESFKTDLLEILAAALDVAVNTFLSVRLFTQGAFRNSKAHQQSWERHFKILSERGLENYMGE